MIDQVTAQKIKDTADIVEVVGDYVHLIRRGANYVGLCPFHNEKTPSFSVNRGKNFCYCFSCKKGGSPVNFIMEKEGLSYHDALIHLAKKYGIEVNERELTDEERAAQTEREGMLVANEWAMQKMEQDLYSTPEGRDIGLAYVYQRGITEEAARKFHIGYAIDRGNELVNAAKKAGYNLDTFKKLGLIGTSKEGREYDRFRGRVMFPIISSAGKVIAFGGRDLKGGPAKYINSPESLLYKKSNELYGLFQARSEMVKQDKCFLVEGYLDVIGMWQSGMQNTVASSGTALTDGQIALIRRFTKNITLIYDGDEAGIKASLRGINMLLEHEMNVKVLLLPDGDDPDSFARKHSPEEFRKYVTEHETDIIRFKTNVLMRGANDPQKRIDAINSVIESLAHISDPVTRDIYIQECSSIMNISDKTIAKSVAKMRAQLVEKWRKSRNLNSQHNADNNAQPSKSTSQQPSSNQYNNQQQNYNYNPLPPQDLFVDDTTDGMYQHAENQPSQTIIDPELTKAQDLTTFPLETSIIKYCVKYGLMPMCTIINDAGENQTLTVIDFVIEELEADNLKFSTDTYNQILSLIVGMKSEFINQYGRYSLELESQLKKEFDNGVAEIASRDLTVAEIKKLEKILTDRIEKSKLTKLTEFTKEFPGRQLASHELSEIRNTAIEMIHERHQLSHIYMRDNNIVEREEDKLEMLIPRALTEWKNELLNIRLKKLLDQLVNANGNQEEEIRLQQEMSKIMAMRAHIAKEIGERIISPK